MLFLEGFSLFSEVMEKSESHVDVGSCVSLGRSHTFVTVEMQGAFKEEIDGH